MEHDDDLDDDDLDDDTPMSLDDVVEELREVASKLDEVERRFDGLDNRLDGIREAVTQLPSFYWFTMIVFGALWLWFAATTETITVYPQFERTEVTGLPPETAKKLAELTAGQEPEPLRFRAIPETQMVVVDRGSHRAATTSRRQATSRR